jgi:hypothetical protein
VQPQCDHDEPGDVLIVNHLELVLTNKDLTDDHILVRAAKLTGPATAYDVVRVMIHDYTRSGLFLATIQAWKRMTNRSGGNVSGRHGPETVAACTTLLEGLQHHKSDVHIATAGLKLLCALATNKQTQEMLVKIPTPRVLIEIMDHYLDMDEPELQIAACDIIYYLCVEGFASRELWSAGAAARLVSVMQKFDHHYRVQVAGCGAIALLVYHDPGEDVIALVDVVQAAMRTFGKKSQLRVQAYGAMALCHLFHCQSAAAYMVQCGLHKRVIAVMEKLPGDSHVQRFVLYMLANLDNNTLESLQAHVHGLVIKAMKRFKWNSKIIWRGFKVLTKLNMLGVLNLTDAKKIWLSGAITTALKDENRCLKYVALELASVLGVSCMDELIDAGIQDTIIDLLQDSDYADDQDLQKMGCVALRAWATCRGGDNAFTSDVHRRIPDILVGIARSSRGVPGTFLACISTMDALANLDSGICDILVEMNVHRLLFAEVSAVEPDLTAMHLQLLVTLLQNSKSRAVKDVETHLNTATCTDVIERSLHNSDQDIQYQSIRLASVLIAIGVCGPTIYQAVVNVMRSQVENDDIQCAAYSFLAKAAFHDNGKRLETLEQRVPELLLERAEQSPIKPLSQCFYATVQNIVADFKVALEFFLEHGMHKLIIRHIVSAPEDSPRIILSMCGALANLIVDRPTEVQAAAPVCHKLIVYLESLPEDEDDIKSMCTILNVLMQEESFHAILETRLSDMVAVALEHHSIEVMKHALGVAHRVDMHLAEERGLVGKVKKAMTFYASDEEIQTIGNACLKKWSVGPRRDGGGSECDVTRKRQQSNNAGDVVAATKRKRVQELFRLTPPVRSARSDGLCFYRCVLQSVYNLEWLNWPEYDYLQGEDAKVMQLINKFRRIYADYVHMESTSDDSKIWQDMESIMRGTNTDLITWMERMYKPADRLKYDEKWADDFTVSMTPLLLSNENVRINLRIHQADKPDQHVTCTNSSASETTVALFYHNDHYDLMV